MRELYKLEPITIVTMIWTQFRQYRVEYAEAVNCAIARHATFSYRFVVVSDQKPRQRASVEFVPFPDSARKLTNRVNSSGYSSNVPKLWLFSDEARCLGDRIFFIDADSIVTGDLAPIVSYRLDSPFVWLNLSGKLQSGMFLLDTGALQNVWNWFLMLGGAYARDGAWLRFLDIGNNHPCWPNKEMGIYLLKDLDRSDRTSPLPEDARIVHPTGKTKPWMQKFYSRYPWAKEHYRVPTL